MKKLIKMSLVTAIAVAGLTTSASAAKVSSLYIGSGIKMDSDSEMVHAIGWSTTDTKSSGLVLGMTLEAEYSKLDEVTTYGLAGEGKVGMNVTQNVDVYGIVGGKVESFRADETDGLNAYGFGFGLGAEYKLSDSMSVEAKYVTYSMTTAEDDPIDNVDYDSSKAAVNLRYTF